MKLIVKGFLHLIIVLVLSSIGLAFASTNNSTHGFYTPYRPFDKMTDAALVMPSISISNSMMGANTPFQFNSDNHHDISFQMQPIHDLSLQTFYSNTYGMSLVTKYAILLNPAHALASELTLGNQQYRLNLTWAYRFLTHHQFKLSAEDLAQLIHFDFDSGSTNTWVHQPAIGFNYTYLINHVIKDINLGAFYSRAISQSLPSREFSQPNGHYINYRHIAGATDTNVNVGTDWLFTPKTQVGLQLNYDVIKYNMRYESSPNTSGFGDTITLDQILTKRVKFQLLQSSREPYDTYKASFYWLLWDVPGSNLELGLTGTRLLGKTGTPNDSQIGMTFSYQWDIPQLGHPSFYSNFTEENSLTDLKDWASTPAVHQEQVLAIKDQKSVQLYTDIPPPSPASPLMNQNTATINLPINKPIDLSLEPYLPKNWQQQNIIITASGLPNQLMLENTELKTKLNQLFTENDLGKEFSIIIEPSQQNPSLSPSSVRITLKIAMANGFEPYPNPNFHPANLILKRGEPIQPITLYYCSNPTLSGYPYCQVPEKGLFYDPKVTALSLTLTPSISGTASSGLTVTSYKNYPPDRNDDGTITLSGTPQNYGTATVSIIASSRYGTAATPQTFTITVPAPIKITPYPQIYSRFQSTDNIAIADISTTSGSIDCNSIAVGIGPDHHSKDGSKKLSDFGLIPFSTCSSGSQKAQLYLKGNVTPATFQSYNFPITAANALDPSLLETSDWNLNVKGVPVVDPSKQNLGGKTYVHGDLFETVTNLADHFNNPIQSGSIDRSQFQVIDEAGEDSKAKYGIHADSNGNLVGTILTSAPPGNHTLYVRARNQEGLSYSPVTSPAYNESAIYSLTIQTAHQPQITVIPRDYFKLGDSPTYAFAHIDAVDGTLNADSLQITINGSTVIKPKPDSPQNVGHGLSASVTYSADRKQADVYLSGKIIDATFNQQDTLALTIQNSYQKSADTKVFDLFIAGPPIKNSSKPIDPQTTITQTSITPIDLTANNDQYFLNPTKSGSIHKRYFVGSIIPSGFTGSLSISDGQLMGATGTTAGTFQVHIKAQNDLGTTSPDSNDAIFPLTIRSPHQPEITIYSKSPPDYTIKQTNIDDIIADIKANDGTIDPDALLINGKKISAWNHYGMQLYSDPATPSSLMHLHLKSTQILDSTFSEEPLIISATNSYQQTSSNTYHLAITGPPQVKSNLIQLNDPSTSYYQGATINSISNLVNRFNNPIKSGEIDNSQFKIEEKNHPEIDVKAKYGLSVNSTGTLTGTIPDDASNLGSHIFYVRAKNSLSTWSDLDKSALYYLTIVEEQSPSVSLHQNDYFLIENNNQPLHYSMIDIQAVQGELKKTLTINGTDANCWRNDALGIFSSVSYYPSDHPTSATIYLNSNQPLAVPTFSPAPTLLISGIKNTTIAPPAADQTFNLNIAGKPVLDPSKSDLGSGSYIQTDTLTEIPDLDTHFKNPTKSDSLYSTFHLSIDKSTLDPINDLGLLGNNNKLSGLIKPTASPGTYSILINAQNKFGLSPQPAVYHLSIRSPHSPVVTPQIIDHLMDKETLHDMTIATLQANDGILDSSKIKLNNISLSSWTAYGLKAKYTPNSQNESQGTIAVYGTITHPMFNENETVLTLSGVKNSYGQSASDSNFILRITGAPVVDDTLQNLGEGSYQQTTAFTSITDLASRFKNPLSASPIQTMWLSVAEKPLWTEQDIQNHLGLKIEKDANNRFNLTGTIPEDSEGVGNWTLHIYASNTVDGKSLESTTYAQYTLHVLSLNTPKITVYPISHFLVHQSNVNYKIADIQSHDGTLIRNQIKLNGELVDTWKHYGMQAVIQYENNDTLAHVYLVADEITDPTWNQPENIVITGVENTFHKTAEPATFVLAIAGVPAVNTTKQDLGSFTYRPGETITVIPDLGSHFDNPAESGPIDNAQFVLLASGAPGLNVTQVYGLSVDPTTGNLIGQIPQNAPIGSQDILVYATNTLIGTSDTYAIYHLSIRAINKPVIATPVIDHFETSQSLSDQIIANFTAGDGTLDTSTVKINGYTIDQWNILSANVRHNLTVGITPDKTKLILNGIISTPTFLEETLTISGLKNNFSLESDPADFKLNIAGKPTVDVNQQDLGGHGITYQPGSPFSPISDLASKFLNPTKSGTLDKFKLTENGAEDVTAKYGLYVDAQGHLTAEDGKIKLDAPVGIVDIHIQAHNTYYPDEQPYYSDTFATYHLDIQPNASPSITISPIESFRNGEPVNQLIATITAGSYELDQTSPIRINGTPWNTWTDQHNLHAALYYNDNLHPTRATLYLTSYESSITHPTLQQEILSITGAKNTGTPPKEQDGPAYFYLNVSDVPSVNPDKANAGSGEYHPTDTFNTVFQLSSLFNNPTRSGDIQSFRLVDLNDPQVSIETTYGIHVDANGNLSGIIAEGAPSSSAAIPIGIYASNSKGESSTYATYLLSIKIPNKPTIETHPLQPINRFVLSDTQPIDYAIATIHANDGELDLDALKINGLSLNDWNNSNQTHGIHAELRLNDSSHPTSATLNLVGHFSSPTFSEETLSITGVKNTYEKQQEQPANFYLNVASTPVVNEATKDLGGSDLVYLQGQTFITVPSVDTHFWNPSASGSIHKTEADFHTQIAGAVGINVKEIYGIYVNDHGDLVGSIKPNAPVTTEPLTLQIHVTNDIGTSDTYAIYHLTIRAPSEPTVTAIPYDHFLYPSEQAISQKIADIDAGDGTLQVENVQLNGIPITSWSSHGLHAELRNNNTQLFLIGTPSSATLAEENISITGFANSYGKTQSTAAHFALNIAGTPVVKSSLQDLGGDDHTYKPGDTFISVQALANHFDNPTKSGTITGFTLTENGQAGVQDRIGLSVDSNGNLVGQIKSTLTPLPLDTTLHVQAINAIGTSTTYAIYHLHVRPLQAPTVTPTSVQSFTEGQALSNITIATLDAHDGELDQAADIRINNVPLSEWSEFGLHASIQYLTDSHKIISSFWNTWFHHSKSISSDNGYSRAEIYLSGTPNNATFDSTNLLITGVKNSYQIEQIAPAKFNLIIMGPPTVITGLQDLGGHTHVYIPGDDFVTVSNLASHFKNPLDSGDIDNSQFILQGPSGIDVSQVYGLYVNSQGDLVGHIPPNVPSDKFGTDILIRVYATNTKQLTSTTYAIYHFSLRDFQSPSVTSNPDSIDHFKTGETLNQRIALVEANEGTLQKGTLKINGINAETWHDDTLGIYSQVVYSPEDNPLTANILLKSNQPLTVPTYSELGLTITGATNSYNKTQTQDKIFPVNIAGAPTLNTDPTDLGGQSESFSPGDTFTPINNLTTYFKNPTASGNISELIVLDSAHLDNPQYVSSTYGLTIVNNSLQGTIKNEAPLGSYLLYIYAKNSENYTSSTYAVYHLIIQAHQTPNVIIHPNQNIFVEGHAVNYTIATITPGEGELDKTSAIMLNGIPLLNWTKHGLRASIQYNDIDHPTEGAIVIQTTDLNDPTLVADTITITGVKNTLGEEQTNPAHFTLDVAGKPWKKQDLGSGTFHPGDIFSTIVNLASYFNNPTASGNISSYFVEADGIPDFKQVYNIYVNSHGDLMGTIPVNAPPLSNKLVKVYAVNDQGASLDYAAYYLTVEPALAPTVEPMTIDSFNKGAVIPQINSVPIATLTAHDGSLDTTDLRINGIPISEWTTHGLKVEVIPGNGSPKENATLATLNVYTPTVISSATFTEENLTITGLKNSYQETQTQPAIFTLNITGKPEVIEATRYLGGDDTVYLVNQPFKTVSNLLSHFNNPTKSGNITLTLKDKNNPSLDVTQAYGLSIDTNNNLTGTLKAHGVTLPIDTEIEVYASNTKGQSNPALYHLQIRETKTPTVTPHSKDFFINNHDTNSFNMADIMAQDGTIKTDDIYVNSTPLLDWSEHNLTIRFIPDDAANPISGHLALISTPNSPTFTEESLNISGIKNSYDKAAGSFTFTLHIADVPHTSDPSLGSGTYKLTTTITPVNAFSHFQNPTQSGALTPASLSLEADNVPNVTETYGLSIDDNGYLSGTIKSTAPVGTKDIKIYATNTVGKSTALTYTLTVQPINKPTVTTIPIDHFENGNTIDATIANLSAEDGSLDISNLQLNGTIYSSWGAHGLHAVLKNNNTELHLVGTITSPTFSEETLTITGLKNSYGETQEQPENFIFNIAGIPEIISGKEDLGGSDKEYAPLDTFSSIPNLSTHFNNPSKSGTISELVVLDSAHLDDPQYVSATYGLTLVNDSLQGTIKNDAPSGSHLLYVYAKNNQHTSFSTTYAVYHLCIRSFYKPTFSVHQNDKFLVGNSALNYTLATIKANDGDIDQTSTITINSGAGPIPVNQWSDSSLGVYTEITYDTTSTARILLRSNAALQTPTYQVVRLTIDGIRNTKGQTPESGSLNYFDLHIADKPHAVADLPSAVWKQDATLTAIPLNTYFKNPSASGTITAYTLINHQLPNQNVTNTYGLSVNQNGELVGTISTTAPTGAVDIEIHAINAIGTSTSYANYPLTVTPLSKPTVQITDHDHFTVGDTLQYKFAEIDAVDGTIDKNSLKVNGQLITTETPYPVGHGASITVTYSRNNTHAELLLTGTLDSAIFDNPENLTVTVQNSYYLANDASLKHDFDLYIAGQPVAIKNIDSQSIGQGGAIHDVDLGANASSYFKNPLKSGEITPTLDSSSLPTGSSLTLTKNQQDHWILSGTIGTNTPTSAYTIHLDATNTAVPASKATINFNLTITSTSAPTITQTPEHIDPTKDIADWKIGSSITNVKIADISPESGELQTIDLSAVNAQLQPYGLVVTSSASKNNTSTQLLISSSKILQPADKPLNFTISLTAKNSYRKETTSVYSIDLAAPTSKKTDIPDQSLGQGDHLSTLSLGDASDYFTNPIHSGKLTLTATSPDARIKVTPSESSGSWTLAFDVDPTTPAGIYTLTVQAANAAFPDQTASTQLKLSVTATTAPSITQTPEHIDPTKDIADWKIGSSITNVKIADISPESGELQTIDLSAVNAQLQPYGLVVSSSMAKNGTSAQLLMSSSQILQPADKPLNFTISLTAKNSYRKETTSVYSIDLAAPTSKKTDIPDQSLGQGDHLSTLSLGDASDYFTNPIHSGKLTLTATSPDARIKVTPSESSGSWTLAFDVDPTTPAGIYTLTVQAANAAFPDQTASTQLKLSVTATTAPSTTPHPKTNPDYFLKGDDLTGDNHYRFASLSAESGILDQSALQIKINSGDWVPLTEASSPSIGHGLSAQVIYSADNKQANLYLTGSISDTLYTNPDLIYITTKNSYRKTAVMQQFSLPISGPLEHKQDMSLQTLGQGESKTIELGSQASTYFTNPLSGGDVTIQVTGIPTGSGIAITPLSQTCTGSSTCQIQISVDSNADLGSISGIRLKGSNVAVSTQSATSALPLTVTESLSPTVTVHAHHYFTVGSSTDLPYTLATLSASTGTLATDQLKINSTLLPEGSSVSVGHGLSVTVSYKNEYKEADLILNGIPSDGTYGAPDSLSIETRNTAKKVSSGNFTLNIAGPPVPNPEKPLPTGFASQSGSITSVDLTHSYFLNPTQSGSIDSYTLTSPSDFKGDLSIVSNTLQGTVKPTNKPGTYTFAIKAHNTQGDSADSAAYHLTVDYDKLYCPAPENIQWNGNVPSASVNSSDGLSRLYEGQAVTFSHDAIALNNAYIGDDGSFICEYVNLNSKIDFFYLTSQNKFSEAALQGFYPLGSSHYCVDAYIGEAFHPKEPSYCMLSLYGS